MRDKQLQYVASSCVPSDALNLIWETFFTSRNRGVTPQFHFPWIYKGGGLTCIQFVEGKSRTKKTIATLILKHKRLQTGGRICLVGLVCVDKSYRGIGIGRRLIELSINQAKKQKFCRLLLWTSKPDFYKQFGFRIINKDLYGPVKRLHEIRLGTCSESEVNDVSIKYENRSGAPPFARQIVTYRRLACSIIVCESKKGWTLVSYEGQLSKVIQLIELKMPKLWYLCLPQRSALIKALNCQGFKADLKPASYEMALDLKNKITLRTNPKVGFLQRI